MQLIWSNHFILIISYIRYIKLYYLQYSIY